MDSASTQVSNVARNEVWNIRIVNATSDTVSWGDARVTESLRLGQRVRHDVALCGLDSASGAWSKVEDSESLVLQLEQWKIPRYLCLNKNVSFTLLVLERSSLEECYGKI